MISQKWNHWFFEVEYIPAIGFKRIYFSLEHVRNCLKGPTWSTGVYHFNGLWTAHTRRAILGILEMLKAFPEKSVEYLTIIEKNARRLPQLIQDLVVPTKIKNKFVIKKRKNQFSRWNNLIKEFTDSANEMNIKIKFVFDEDQTFYVYGHRTKLYQGFADLIGNCLKFTKDGSIDILLARYSNNTIDKKPCATL